MSKMPYVEQEECTGCAICEERCPEVFRLDEDGLSEVYDPARASEEEIQEVIDNCPVECIYCEEE